MDHSNLADVATEGNLADVAIEELDSTKVEDNETDELMDYVFRDDLVQYGTK